MTGKQLLRTLFILASSYFVVRFILLLGVYRAVQSTVTEILVFIGVIALAIVVYGGYLAIKIQKRSND
ncbi:hypothetical protein DH09_06215 [Bacillaceae bacterium JMAK1]|nr:hypothetical protein DH09_06215 [Bacillaceae bacterium JMAK1]